MSEITSWRQAGNFFYRPILSPLNRLDVAGGRPDRDAGKCLRRIELQAHFLREANGTNQRGDRFKWLRQDHWPCFYD